MYLGDAMGNDFTITPRGLTGNLTPDDLAFVDVWGAKIGMQIAYGNRESAHDLVNAACEARSQLDTPAIMAMSLAELGLDVRTCNTLERHASISNVGELLECDVADLLTLPNVGPNSILSVFAKLASFSIRRVIELEGKQQ